MEPLGTQLRRQRRRLGLSLDDVTKLTGISKPYLSLVETNKTKSPPSDGKLRKLEETLKFPEGALLVRAHLARTPEDVRGMIQSLLGRTSSPGTKPSSSATDPGATALTGGASGRTSGSFGVSLDDAYLSGALQAIVEERAGNAEFVGMVSVPIINKVSAGYPRDFTDMGYPARVADEYVPAPAAPVSHAANGSGDSPDRDRFAARVHGDSMSPDYRPGDVVVFSAAAEPRSGDDCFVRLEDGRTTFKRAYFEKDAAGRDVVRLEPLNKRYDPRILLADRVAGVYRAVWVSRAIGSG